MLDSILLFMEVFPTVFARIEDDQSYLIIVSKEIDVYRAWLYLVGPDGFIDAVRSAKGLTIHESVLEYGSCAMYHMIRHLVKNAHTIEVQRDRFYIATDQVTLDAVRIQQRVLLCTICVNGLWIDMYYVISWDNLINMLTRRVK